MHVVLCANAPVDRDAEPRLKEAIEASDILVGVDGGARTLLQLGFVPDWVTGDGDSLSEAERIQLRQAGAQLFPTPDQDYTDLDKALRFSRETLGASSIAVFGATGGRLDHSYSVFSALLKHGKELPVMVLDATATYERVGESWERHGEALIGRTLSLMAFGRVEGITTWGVAWPLEDDWLEPGVRDGTLNRVTQSTVGIQVGSGALVVMLHH